MRQAPTKAPVAQRDFDVDVICSPSGLQLLKARREAGTLTLNQEGFCLE